MHDNRIYRHVAVAALAALFATTSAPLLAQSAPPVSRDAQAARYYEDALARFEKKDFAGAAIQLKNALKLDNKSIASQVLLGKVLLAKGDVGAAEVALNEALRLGINRAEVLLPLTSLPAVDRAAALAAALNGGQG